MLRWALLIALICSSCALAQVSLYSEGLYWKSALEGADWALLELNSGNGVDSNREIRRLVPDVGWGFRAGGSFDPNCSCFGLRCWGLYIQTPSHAQLNFPVLIPAQGDNVADLLSDRFLNSSAGFIRAAIRRRYWAFSGEASWGVAWFTLFMGVRHASLQERQTSDYFTTEFAAFGRAAQPVQTVEFEGTGPVVGFGAEVDLLWSFRLAGRVSALGLIGKTKGNYIQNFGTRDPVGPSYVLFLNPQSLVVPGAELRVQVEYCQSLLFVKAGFELHTFWNVLNRPFNGQLTVSTLQQGFGFGGPFFGLGVRF